MDSTRFALYLLITSAWLGGFSPREAVAQPVPLGPETRVDNVAGDQFAYDPLLAVQPGGGFEIAWDYGGGSLNQRVYARHFAADGKPTSPSPVLLGQGMFPKVKAVTATLKGFEVLWQWGDWPRNLHYRRHLNLQGVPDPGPAVRMAGIAAITPWVWQVRGNGFMAGWPTQQIADAQLKTQRLTPAGRLTGPVIQLTTRPVVLPDEPVLTALALGGFLAVWNGLAPDTVLRARRFSPPGAPLSPEIDVNTTRPDERDDYLYDAKVAAAPGGGFAVSWSFYDKATDSSTSYLRLFDAASRPLGPEIPGPALSRVQSMAFDDAGNLLVLWSLYNSGPDLRIQLFDPDGAPLGSSVSVASSASGEFNQPQQGSVAWTGNSWVVAWAGQVGPFERRAVFVRRFAGGT